MTRTAELLHADVFTLFGDFMDGDPTVRAEAAPRFEILDDSEFITGDYRSEFLVTNVLVKGQPCGIGGPLKAMKTGLSVDLATSLGTGSPFLGTFAVPRPVTTVVVSGESGKATILETRDRILKAKGFRPGEPFDTLKWCFDVPNLSDVTAMAEFTAVLAARKPEVVILDPLYLMLGDVNAASMFETGNLLRTVATTLHAAGATVVICHHANRQLANGYRDAEFQFGVKRNLEELVISEDPVLKLENVGGWSFVWVYYRTEDQDVGGGVKKAVVRPIDVYEERIFEYGDFSGLQIGKFKKAVPTPTP